MPKGYLWIFGDAIFLAYNSTMVYSNNFYIHGLFIRYGNLIRQIPPLSSQKNWLSKAKYSTVPRSRSMSHRQQCRHGVKFVIYGLHCADMPKRNCSNGLWTERIGDLPGLLVPFDSTPLATVFVEAYLSWQLEQQQLCIFKIYMWVNCSNIANCLHSTRTTNTQLTTKNKFKFLHRSIQTGN